MKTNINSYVMHVAHAMAGRLPDKKLRAPWSVYVRNGWFAVSLRKALKAGVFEFEYIKNNGETRLALGTLLHAAATGHGPYSSPKRTAPKAHRTTSLTTARLPTTTSTKRPGVPLTSMPSSPPAKSTPSSNPPSNYPGLACVFFCILACSFLIKKDTTSTTKAYGGADRLSALHEKRKRKKNQKSKIKNVLSCQSHTLSPIIPLGCNGQDRRDRTKFLRLWTLKLLNSLIASGHSSE